MLDNIYFVDNSLTASGCFGAAGIDFNIKNGASSAPKLHQTRERPLPGQGEEEEVYVQRVQRGLQGEHDAPEESQKVYFNPHTYLIKVHKILKKEKNIATNLK